MTDEKTQSLKVLSRFALGLGVLGGLLIIFGLYFLFISNESLAWSSVEGAVVNTQVNSHVSRTANPAGGVANSLVEYYVSVDYTYEVEGSPYFSSRYSLGEGDRASPLYSERVLAEQEATARFPADSRLTVYYDPDMPTSAVLAPGWNWGTFVPLLLGIFLGGSAWLFHYTVSKARVSSG